MFAATLLTALLGITAWMYRRARQPQASAAGPLATATAVIRSIDPKRQAALSPVWELRRAPNCQARHAVNGPRLATADTVALAVPGKQACDCHYRPLKDLRKRERRQQLDRRDALRFDLERADRRLGDRARRRDERVWHGLRRI